MTCNSFCQQATLSFCFLPVFSQKPLVLYQALGIKEFSKNPKGWQSTALTMGLFYSSDPVSNGRRQRQYNRGSEAYLGTHSDPVSHTCIVLGCLYVYRSFFPVEWAWCKSLLLTVPEEILAVYSTLRPNCLEANTGREKVTRWGSRSRMHHCSRHYMTQA